jgi:hypothetical protein
MSLRRIALAFVLVLAACSEPPDESPLGRECSAILARTEQKVDVVKVQHVLLAFVGAKRGSESKHTREEAERLAGEVLAKARAGEDFAALVKAHSYDEGDGVFQLTQKKRGDYARSFADVAFRLAPGEVGIASYHRSRSPFGWHVIKRLE